MRPATRRSGRGVARIGLLCATVLLAAAPRAQDETQDPQRPDAPWGKTVVDVVIEPAFEVATIRRILTTKKGQPLQVANIQIDEQVLWKQLKLYVQSVEFAETEDGVIVYFRIESDQSFDRFEFKGLEEFTEVEVRTLLGLDSRQQINRRSADQYALTLEERYARKGFASASVRIEEDPDDSTLTFWVDEGPKATIEHLHFVGNRAYANWAFVGFFENVSGGSQMESVPGGRLTPGAPYSAEIVDEDLDRLRLFYRERGFRDAQVELAGVVFSPDREDVELTFRIVEGRRYRVASIDLEQVPPPDATEPTYAAADVLAEIEMEPGDFYDFQRIELDRQRIQRFYGERGHPLDGQFGRGIANPFRISGPLETFDVEKAEIHLRYVVEEGTPKTLRAVTIRGNSDTKDFVIRRGVRVLPGEILDTVSIERSRQTLDRLRYFSDSRGFGGVRFELLPVPEDPDQADLAIDVTEGDTGSFRWGAGFSTAAGANATLQLSKRNFDIARPPSSWNPVDWFSEIANNEALHGAGQSLEMLLSPGTQISTFGITFYEPDIFREHIDTWGMQVRGYRRLAFIDSYNTDALGATLGLIRNFTPEFQVGAYLEQQTVEIRARNANAPTIVFDSEGQSELRGVRFSASYADLDSFLFPSEGFRTTANVELKGGPFGADESYVTAGILHSHYVPVYRDELERPHVLRMQARFDYGAGFGGSDDLFLTERFYLGGLDNGRGEQLRGFDQRRAGPTQFGFPVGGEARFTSSLEYQFPLFSTREQGRLRQTEVLRGAIFTDYGMLGLGIDDLGPPRWTAGFGVILQLPVLQVPIALNLAWPILQQETDNQRQFSFQLSRF